MLLVITRRVHINAANVTGERSGWGWGFYDGSKDERLV
jgi:hypothetical protein